ncbi:MAG: PQQ-binding-like beta-propeller repeat protein [Burkholderiaceae bacterium]
MNFKTLASGLLAAALVACGGGGGGSSNPPVTISASPTTLALSATTTGAAPTGALVVSASNVPTNGLYLSASSSGNGVTTTTTGGDGAAQNLTIMGASPNVLGVGHFTDTVTIKVCYDSQCKQQVSNSPMQVHVTYVISLGDPATATPTLASITPSTALLGSSAITIVATGSQFAPSTVLQWNGQARATTYVSPTSISAQINASDLATLGTDYVSVSNASTGGGQSFSVPFNVSEAAPVVSAISPSTLGAGGSAFTLTVTGTGFDGGSQIQWNGSARSTVFVSTTQLSALIAATDIASTGAFPIRVNNPYGNVQSNAVTLNVIDAPLALNAISPAFVTVGAPAYVETVIGNGFNSSSVVQWNGSARTTTFVSTTQLQARITAADIASAGTSAITVANSGANAGTSGAQTLTIGSPSRDAVAWQINPQHNGAISFANVVAPSAFPLSSTWTTTLDGPVSYALIAGGRIFVTVSLGGGGSELIALSAADGARVWGPIALPYAANATYDNGKVIVLSANIGTPGMLSAYDAATGTQTWSTALTSQYWFTDPPTAMNGMVYAGGAGSGGTLYAVNEANGALTWTASVENGDNSSPAVTADGVYVSYPCQTYDFNPLTGALIWNNSTGCEGGGGATGTIANGVYYSPNDTTGFNGMSFDAESGAFVSSYATSQPPAIGAHAGYFLQAGTLRAITLAGNVIQWSFAGDGTLSGAPILVNGYVFITSGSGLLYAVDATTGAQLWQASLAGTIPSYGTSQLQASGLTAGDGLLLVPAGSTLTAYTLSNNP